ncbi:hypothetical protein [Methanoregula sp. UBA64]|uniref:hypothetical protein n=1 Tax=Methanoregula sp. UBA64 TaxID=1915554 RepID=UPI0025D56102|nr:hypothetical protein [Methanoregula sp. UBA64]
MCSEIRTVPGKDPSATIPDPCTTCPADDPTVERDDLLTDINGCSYIEVRICDLDRFCSK